MDALINFLITYLNPLTWLNLLWAMLIDSIYLLFQFVIDLLTSLMLIINWVCPVFPNLEPSPMVLQVAKNVAWVIPWHYGAQMLIVMAGCTMFAIMTMWTLRWLKVLR